jgi:hypothetical protein
MRVLFISSLPPVKKNEMEPVNNDLQTWQKWKFLQAKFD